MPAARAHRAVLIAISLLGYGIVFSSFLLFEVPGLGLGHFYYVAIVLIALVTGPLGGMLAGMLADGLYALGIFLNPNIPSGEILSTSTGIRLITYTGMGALIGYFARNNARLIDHLRTAADRDFLTGILNPRAFDEALVRRLEEDRPFGIVMGDTDGLKGVKDSEGHAVGNDVLRRAAEVLTTVLRTDDQLARVGGDEFAVLTSTSSTDGVRALAGRLTAALASEGIGMSFGWAVHPRDGSDPLTLFRTADERLYAQKLIRSRLMSAEIVELPTERDVFPLRSVR
jgi:diguanylate cyclase (GGDEF)-like protein